MALTVHNDDTNINYLIYCQSGHVRINRTLFHDEILCAGEIMFVPRQSECTGTALSDVTLLIHKFNNTICYSEKCILSYLYSHRHIDDKTDDLHIWQLKHKELIWIFKKEFGVSPYKWLMAKRAEHIKLWTVPRV